MPDLHLDGLRAFYCDLTERRNIHNGQALRPATRRASWEELERFARLKGGFSTHLLTAMRRTLETLRDDEAQTTQQKYAENSWNGHTRGDHQRGLRSTVGG